LHTDITRKEDTETSPECYC